MHGKVKWPTVADSKGGWSAGLPACCRSATFYSPLSRTSPLQRRYYTQEVHRAAFVLPAFAKEALAGSLTY